MTKLVIKAERKKPYGHTAYARTQHGKVQLVAPRGVKPDEQLADQAFAQKLQRKIGRLSKGKGRSVKLTQEELKVVLDSGKFALISAGKSPHDKDGFTKYDAQKRHKILKANLVSQGYAFTPVVGNYDGEEDSFLVMVHDADLGDMMSLGKALKQDSIIFGTEGKYTAYFTTGENVGMCVHATSWSEKQDADNYYTEYKHPDGKTTKFALDLDFDAKVKCEEKVAALTLPDLVKSISHERFLTTAMTVPGRVRRITEGRFGARKVTFANDVKAVLKPKLFSTETFRGIPRNTQHMREAAAYQLDRQLLHFNVVPPTFLTMYREDQASLQAWVTGLTAGKIVEGVFNRKHDDWKERVVKLATKVDIAGLRKVALFDLVTNNTDRHAKNCIFDTFSGRVWAIDNGLCFGRYYKNYNNVFHRYLFRRKLRLTAEETATLSSITHAQLSKVLGRYLSKREIDETYWRIQWMLEQPSLGFADIAPETEGKNDFPSRKAWFREKMRKEPKNRVLARLDEMDAPFVVSSAVA